MSNTTPNPEAPTKGKSAFQHLVSAAIAEMRKNPAEAAIASMRVMYAPNEIITDVFTLYDDPAERSKELVSAFVQIAASWEWMAQQMNLPITDVMQERLGNPNSGNEGNSENPAADSSTGSNGNDQTALLEESAAGVVNADRLANELFTLLQRDPMAFNEALMRVMAKAQPEIQEAQQQSDAELSVVHSAEQNAGGGNEAASTEESTEG